MYKSIILPLAKQDIKEAAAWYNERQAGLGKRFIQTYPTESLVYPQNPKAVTIRYDDNHTIVLDTFPYMIHFRVDDDNKLVIISAVLSTHRDPEMWNKR